MTDYSPRHSILELRKMLAEVDSPQLKHFEIQWNTFYVPPALRVAKRLDILVTTKCSGNLKTRWRQSLLQKETLRIVVKTYTKSRYYFFLVRSNFTASKSPYSVQIQENKEQRKLRIWTLSKQYFSWFLYFVPNALSSILEMVNRYEKHKKWKTI